MSTGFKSALVKCAICTHEWVAVYPASAEDILECESCGAQDSEVIRACITTEDSITI